GGVGLEPDLVGELRGFQPLAAVDFVIADDVAHAVGENLRAAAGERIHTSAFQLLQSFADGKLRALGKIRHLDHGESFQVDLGEALLESRDQIKEVLKRQIGMQAANDVKFSDG